MLDHSGYVAGTGENLFVIKDGFGQNPSCGQYFGWNHAENSLDISCEDWQEFVEATHLVEMPCM